MWIDGKGAMHSIALLRPRRAVDHELVEHVRRLSTDKLRCANTAIAAYARAVREHGGRRERDAETAERRPHGLVLHDVKPHETLIRGLERQLDDAPDPWTLELADAIVTVIGEEIGRRTRSPRPTKTMWGRILSLPRRQPAEARAAVATASPSSGTPRTAHR